MWGKQWTLPGFFRLLLPFPTSQLSPAVPDIWWSRPMVCIVGGELPDKCHPEGNCKTFPFETRSLSKVWSPKDWHGAQFHLMSSWVFWMMGSSVMWWRKPPHWLGIWMFQKGEPLCSKTRIDWKIRCIRTLWNSTRTNVRSWTWENTVQVCNTTGIYCLGSSSMKKDLEVRVYSQLSTSE